MRLFFMLILLVAGSTFTEAQINKEIPVKAYNLYRFFEKQHYKPIEWNDSSSSKLFDAILSDADDEKLLFTKEDIKKLETYRYSIDDDIKNRTGNFITAFSAIFKQRLHTVDSAITVVLAQLPDIGKTESMVYPYTDYAATTKELFTRAASYYKWEILGQMGDSLIALSSTNNTIVSAVPTAIISLERSVQQDMKKSFNFRQLKGNDVAALDKGIGELYLNHISKMYDPHSDYFSFVEKQQFQSEVSATAYTAGIIYDKNKNDEWEITRLVPGGPAWRSGQLHEKDVIIAVNNDDSKDIETKDLTEKQLDELIDANLSERVTVTIKSAAGLQKTVKIVKEKLSDDASLVSSFLLSGDKKIGYIQLPGFYTTEEGDKNGASCAEDVAKEIVKLKKDNIDGIILDLRNNGGGSMGEALQLAGIFINEGILAMIKDNKGKVINLRDPNRGTIYDGKLMVLINGTSASASELTSAVLQDYNRALIAGGNTYGKGTAQVVLPLDTADNIKPEMKGDDYVKVTDEKFYRVNGNTVQWRGVVPDITLPDVYQQPDNKERNEPQALLPDSIKKVTFNILPALPTATLAASSFLRVNKSSYFKLINEYVNWSANKKATRTIPLRWDQYAVYYKQRNALSKQLEADKNDEPVIFRPLNNGIDADRTNFMSPQSKDINAYKLKILQKDLFLSEAYNIMLDWIKNTP